MPQIEILAYSPLEMDKFIDFVVNGVRDDNGNFVKDDQDRLITGVLAWLHGREIPRAQFFSSNATDPVQLFVSVIEPTEPEIVPWMRLVPGFHDRVRSDGLIGLVGDFRFGTSASTAILDSVMPRHDIDDVFALGKEKINSIDFSKRSFTRAAFLAALGGRPGTNVLPMLAEVESALQIKIAEERTEFRATP